MPSRELTRQMLTLHNAQQTTDDGQKAIKKAKKFAYIIGTNLLTKFHEDLKIKVASRVLTRKNAPPPGSHVFQQTGIIFELVKDIIGMNLLTKFHEYRTVNVASRVKNAPPLYHDDRQINVTSRVLTRKNAPPPWKPYIIGMNLLTEFHEDRTINVASREKCPPLGSNVFQAKVTIFKLIQDIIGTNLLTKFHEDWKINVASRVHIMKNAPPPGGHVFQPTGIIFELIPRYYWYESSDQFHEDWTINVASRVLTRFYHSHIKKNAPPPGGHVFKATKTIFELIQDIIGTNLLTKFHDDRKINVTSIVLTRKNAPPLAALFLKQTFPFSKLIQDIIKTNLLT
ncbi:hypothetical protein DPMN_036348 [Dreissena polymorpha]|uniref:Uncharacterized protein n=1 Tax=Dreissena polymorpha TaxID=45954 RepID=A0A9D4RNR4_DREPO|nr:hypothetical protein DPMN_036348 [Dreissena polymorpha]